MGLEQDRRGQNDPAEIAIAEQQGPVNFAHEATIRAWSNQRFDEGNNDRFPERVMIERRSDLMKAGRDSS